MTKTTEELAKRRAWAAIHFNQPNCTEAELDIAVFMPSENFSDGWDKGSEYALSHQWIPVDERLPEPRQRVLVWIGDEAFACWYTKSGRFKTTLRSKERYSDDKSLHERIHLSPCREDVTDVVTHWMEIPKLTPKRRKMNYTTTEDSEAAHLCEIYDDEDNSSYEDFIAEREQGVAHDERHYKLNKKAKVNGETLELVRQLRQLTQKEVSESIGISQGQLSKAEHGIQELDQSTLECLASFYKFPVSFFFRELDPTPVSHFCYRKRVTSNKILDSFVAVVQIFKIFIEDFLNPVELPEYDLPSLIPSEDLTVEEIADRVRYALGIYKGPVPNLTTLLENHGIIISKIDFGTDKLDGLSTFNSRGRRIIFLNSRMPNDRLRLSLAHELGHTIMHMPQLPDPSQDVEAEANRFAAQFLMPAQEIESMLVGVNIYDLGQLKKKWKVSIKALLYRAKSLMTISERSYRNLQIFYSKKGYNHGEPFPLSYEMPTLLTETIGLYKAQLGYSEKDLMNMMTIGSEEYHRIFNTYYPFKLNNIFNRN